MRVFGSILFFSWAILSRRGDCEMTGSAGISRARLRAISFKSYREFSCQWDTIFW